jgi:hypothetical protein
LLILLSGVFPQETYTQLIHFDLSFAVVLSVVFTSIQQSILSEPVSRFLELLLYGTVAP